MKNKDPRIQLNNLDSYDYIPIINNYGLYTNKPIFSRQFMINGQNEKFYQCFTLLYNNNDLMVNHDRCAFYRPTKNLVINDQLINKVEWKTDYNYPGLHLDFNSNQVKSNREKLNYKDNRDFISENNQYCQSDGLQLQTVINLIDNEDQDGGFQCVPRFSTIFGQWIRDYSGTNNSSAGLYLFNVNFKSDMSYIRNIQRVSFLLVLLLFGIN